MLNAAGLVLCSNDILTAHPGLPCVDEGMSQTSAEAGTLMTINADHSEEVKSYGVESCQYFLPGAPAEVTSAVNEELSGGLRVGPPGLPWWLRR